MFFFFGFFSSCNWFRHSSNIETLLVPHSIPFHNFCYLKVLKSAENRSHFRRSFIEVLVDFAAILSPVNVKSTHTLFVANLQVTFSNRE